MIGACAFILIFFSPYYDWGLHKLESQKCLCPGEIEPTASNSNNNRITIEAVTTSNLLSESVSAADEFPFPYLASLQTEVHCIGRSGFAPCNKYFASNFKTLEAS